MLYVFLLPGGSTIVYRGCFRRLEKLQKLRAEASSLDAALESGVRRYGELVGVAGSGTFSEASTSRSPSNSGLTRITIDLLPSHKKSKAAGNRA